MHLLLFLVLLAPAAIAQPRQWTQWAGPGRDFHAPHTGAQLRFPEGGPRQLWKRDLGDGGYSGILSDGAQLITAYRKGDQNIVLAVDAKTGKTIWEQPFASEPLPNMFLDYGKGPNATPLLVGDRVFAITFTGKLAALDRSTGKILWQHELWKGMNGTFRDVGYSNSPIAYKDTVILPVGGTGKGVVAFRQIDGKIAWQSTDFPNAMSSPILISVDGEEQLVLFMTTHVAGVSPSNGKLLWSYPHKTDYDVNSATPVWCKNNILLVSSAYNAGTRAIQLTRVNGKTEAKELWFQRRMRVHHGNMLRLDNYVYASSGDFGPAPLTAVEVTTGAVAWQSRHFPKASLVQVGAKTLILDEDGRLALARLTPASLEVLQEAPVLTKLAWTYPTVVDNRVYIRDQKSLVALELARE